MARAGTRRSLALVAVLLFLNYTTAERLVPWQWPVVSWQMYGAKAPIEPTVRFRRLIAHDEAGTTRPTSDCGTMPFIEPSYRLDALIRTNAPLFVKECLVELRSVEPSVVGVSFERRTWNYAEETLEQQLGRSPTLSFRAALLPAPRPTVAPKEMTGKNLLSNGDFSRMDPKPGPPRRWNGTAKWLGFGVDLRDDNTTGLIAKARGKARHFLEQEVKVAPAAAASRLRLTAWVHAVRQGAELELELRGGGRQSVAVPHDGAWHWLELELEAPPRERQGRATVRVINRGRADVFVDDVHLTELSPP
jgi:hypothetical protein